MSRHESKLRLRHMLDHAREAYGLIRDRSREEVLADRTLSLALLRLLEVMGEAASRVPSEDRASHPAVPWREIVGLRNRLIHGYNSVDLNIIWHVVTTDLPPLIKALEALLSEDTRDNG